MEYDFIGWATKPDLKCSDGRVIMRDAFLHNDGKEVPLVWNHRHDDPSYVIGLAKLKNEDGGVKAYCKFNDTENGKLSKELVHSHNISSLSICANKLKQADNYVKHGDIKEVSLVLAGANPGAYIDQIMEHGEDGDNEAIIFTGEPITLYHSDEKKPDENPEEKPEEKGVTEKMPDNKPNNTDEKTIGDIFETLNDEQKDVVYAMIGAALEENGGENPDDEEDDEEMKHNIFDQDAMEREDMLMHAELIEKTPEIFADFKRNGSLRESALVHGIDQIDYLFPEPQTLNRPPEFISRKMDWVSVVMNGVHHTPFSRIKSMFADITADEARAKGYFKGNLKKDEVFGLLKRTTTPTTIYKKQKFDRDDLIDITDFDVVAWIKGEMRTMLDEELARAYLIGDGRLASSDDKINEQNIRPIISDDDLYTIKAKVTVSSSATADEKAKEFIRQAVKIRKDYRGSGEPTLFTTEDVLTDCLLMEDTTGRIIYDTLDKLKNVLRVKDIVTVPVLEGVKGKNGGDLMGIIVNLNDYNVGADKGGAVNMFDDFDIDYNAQKYLIETRCSGALIKPYSAIALELVTE